VEGLEDLYTQFLFFCVFDHFWNSDEGDKESRE